VTVRRGDGGVHQLPASWARVKRKLVHPEERASTSRPLPSGLLRFQLIENSLFS
jgi:hypothetical protein